MKLLVAVVGWLMGATNLIEALARVGTTLMESGVLYLTRQWTVVILHWHA